MINIDEIIVRYKKAGRKNIKWNRAEWKVLSDYIWAGTCELFTGKNGYKIKSGDIAFGIKHFKL